MLFSPMLPEAASGMLEPRHCVVPLRMMCPHAELLLGRATAVDERSADRHGRDRRGDARAGIREPRRRGRLRLARASHPGARRARLGFHDLADAIRLRNHVLRRLEAAAAGSTRQTSRAS